MPRTRTRSRFPISPSAASSRRPPKRSRVLDAYLGDAERRRVAPTSSLVTGYDFLADAADAVSDDLAAGTAHTPDTLIAPNNISPRPIRQSWTATQLRSQLLGHARTT